MKCGICDEEYAFDFFVTELCPQCMLSVKEQDDAAKITTEILDLFGIKYGGPPWIKYVKIELSPYEFPAVTVELWVEKLSPVTVTNKYRLVRE